MWGCIVQKQLEVYKPYVPSLYVRVYRKAVSLPSLPYRSLIICEGVSIEAAVIIWEFLFPHYMWGCIAFILACFHERNVPSLYVRVYRYSSSSVLSYECSLIICEGVSWTITRARASRGFPHYMWGCIAERRVSPPHNLVPSLYVRVYRMAR